MGRPLVPSVAEWIQASILVDERSSNVRTITMRLDTRPPKGQRSDISHEAFPHLRAPLAGGLDLGCRHD